MADRGDPEPPVVTVRGGPPERAGDPRPGTALRTVGLGLAAAAVVLAVVQGQREEQARTTRRVPVPVDAGLHLVGRAVTVSQGGVLVLPVVLQDLGPGLTVTSARVYAEPVRDDPSTTPPDAVPPGTARRFVVLLRPDCRLLGARSGLVFRASVLVQVAQEGSSRQLVLDLAADPAVTAVVDGLCGRA